MPRSAHRHRPEATPYVDLTRAEWSALRDKTPLPLTAEEVEKLRGLGDVIDLDEVRDIYLPLSRLLNLYVGATDGLRNALNTFLGEQGSQSGTPFVIGVAGSVAVGKSTVARLLQALLSRWPEHPRVELVTTDGFLLPTKELEGSRSARRTPPRRRAPPWRRAAAGRVRAPSGARGRRGPATA
ncbi:hypothetical protein ACLMMR_39490, partial [Streptomyces sp. NPDC000405]